MNTRRRLGLAFALAALAALVSVLAAPALPATLVTHWNAAGEPDGTMPTAFALALLPALAVGLVALLVALPRLDPRGERYAAFRAYYDWLVVFLAGFLLAIHAGIVAFNLGYRFDFVALLLVCVGALFYYVGVVLAHAEPNWFVGVRTPWTLESDEVWARTHALASRLFKLSALGALLGALVGGELAVVFVLVPALATAAASVAYSYVLYRRLERDGGE